MTTHAELDRLQARIRRKSMVGMDTIADRHEAAQLVRQFVPGESERRTALHEAAHATAMELGGIRCKAAYTKGQPRAEWGTGDAVSPRARAVVALVGSLSEDGTLVHMSEQDRSILHDEVEKLRPAGGSTAGIVESLQREARQFVSEHHETIADVAAHLQEHGTSFGYEIGTIVEKSLHAKRQRPSRTRQPDQYAKGDRVVLGRVGAVVVARCDTRQSPRIGAADWMFCGRDVG
jgi:hypothetical protein